MSKSFKCVSSPCLMLGYQLSDGGHQLVRDLHDSLTLALGSSLVFRDRLIFSLSFVVREDFPHPVFVPTIWKAGRFYHPSFAFGHLVLAASAAVCPARLVTKVFRSVISDISE